MRSRLPVLTALAGALILAAPAAAAAAPPANDNYLASTTINAADGSVPPEFSDNVDTSEATTQADTFDPNRDGLPFAGGPPEPTSCTRAPSYSKTVWYDLSPGTFGGAEIQVAGFDAVVAVYEWNAMTSKITKTLVCQNDSSATAEDVLLPDLLKGHHYTVQVGGVNGAAGQLDFKLLFFPDRDHDTVLDAQDECPTLPGIEAFGGCPPTVRGTPRITFDRVGRGIKVTTLVVDRVTKNARVEVRCRRCGPAVKVKARRSGSLDARAFVGRVVPSGDYVSVKISQPKEKTGRYRFGAFSRTITWPIKGQALGKRAESCSQPGSNRRVSCP